MRKTKADKRAETIEKLAREIALPKAALTEDSRTPEALKRSLSEGTAIIRFNDPDPFHEFAYPNILEAKKAIAAYLGIPLSKLSKEERGKIDTMLSETLQKREIIDQVRCHFRQQRKEVKNVK